MNILVICIVIMFTTLFENQTIWKAIQINALFAITRKEFTLRILNKNRFHSLYQRTIVLSLCVCIENPEDKRLRNLRYALK